MKYTIVSITMLETPFLMKSNRFLVCDLDQFSDKHYDGCPAEENSIFLVFASISCVGMGSALSFHTLVLTDGCMKIVPYIELTSELWEMDKRCLSK